MKDKIIDYVDWYKLSSPDDDDWFASVGAYSLRVEKMHKNNWWWALYKTGDEIDCGNYRSCDGALLKVELEMVKDIYRNKIQELEERIDKLTELIELKGDN